MSSPVAQRQQGGYVDRPRSSSLAEVVDLILDKGLVIDRMSGPRSSGARSKTRGAIAGAGDKVREKFGGSEKTAVPRESRDKS